MAVKKATTKKEKPAKKTAIKKVVKKPIAKKVEKVHPVKSSEGGISQSEIISRGKEKVQEIKSQVEKDIYNVSGEKIAGKMVGESIVDIFA